MKPIASAFLRGVLAAAAAWSAAAAAHADTVPYAVAHEADAQSCELWVDGFAVGSWHYTWRYNRYFDAYVRVAQEKLAAEGRQVLNVGLYTKEKAVRETEGVSREAWVESTSLGAPVVADPAQNLWVVRHTLEDVNQGLSPKGRTVITRVTNDVAQFAVFVDVRDEGGAVSRYWLKNGWRDFSFAEVVTGYPYAEQSLGLGYVRYLYQDGDSPVFATRKACLGR